MEGLRKTLDNLMGKDRNLPIREQLIKKKHFDDPDVCKFFLIGFCPHELFIHVKSSNIGECHYRHDQQFKINFENCPNKEYYQTKYEESLIVFLESIIADVESKMKRCLERIEAPIPDQIINKENQEKIEKLDQQITEKIRQAENLGELGMIDESEKLMKEIEQIKVERNVLTNTKEYPAIYKDRQMKVCEICGALQSAQDNEKRIQTHKDGKIHSAYLKIRQYLDLLRNKRMERRIKEAEMKQKEKLIKELKMKEKYIEKEYKYKNNYNSSGRHSHDKGPAYKKRYYEDYDRGKRDSRSRSSSMSRNRSRNRDKSYSRDKKKYNDKYYHNNYSEDKYGYKEKEKRRDREERDYRDYRDINERRYSRDKDKYIKDNNIERDREKDRKDEKEYERGGRDIRSKINDKGNSYSYGYDNKKRF